MYGDQQEQLTNITPSTTNWKSFLKSDSASSSIMSAVGSEIELGIFRKWDLSTMFIVLSLYTE